MTETEPAAREPSSRPAALSFRGFGCSVQQRGRDVVLLRNVDLEVPAGGFYLLLGRSGSGKSTLLRMITGLIGARESRPNVSGQLVVLGHPATGALPPTMPGRVSAVLQREGLLDELSPRKNVELALVAAERSPKLAVGLLSQAGLQDPPERVADLSGGMRKRAAVARALAAEPELFLFDEPTAGLDAAAAREIVQLLRETHDQRRRTTIIISHDVPAFEGVVDGVLILNAETRSLTLEEPGIALPEWTQPEPLEEPDRFEDPAVHGARVLLLILGALGETLVDAILRLPPVFPRLVLRSVLVAVLESVLFVSAAAVLVGGLSVYFALRNNPMSGAFVDELLMGSGKILVVVLTPMVAGLFFTARMAAGAAARLGTMQHQNGVAALQMMGIRPTDYLLTPMTWAFALSLPVVTFAGMAFAALAAAGMARLVEDVSMGRFSTNFFARVSGLDVQLVMLKAAVSGFLVAVFAFHLAMAPKRSSQDVGTAVNLSIVVGMLTVLVVHGIVTILQFA